MSDFISLNFVLLEFEAKFAMFFCVFYCYLVFRSCDAHCGA